MLLRNCAGGIVFYKAKVFMLKNEKGEWVLPKGIIRNGELPNEVALSRVKEEADIEANILSTVGRTSYEFYSVTRQKPVCNKITWYIMQTDSDKFAIGEPDKFIEAGFFSTKDAVEKLTYSQDKSLLKLSIKKYGEILKTDLAS